MKLYATITASKLVDGKYITVKKGQGSNRNINIDISMDGTEVPRYKLFINNFEDGTQNIVLTDMLKPFPNTVFEKQIGEKKKGEGSITCHQCNTHFYGMENKEDTCPQCLKDMSK